jgi:hypothetical protein
MSNTIPHRKLRCETSCNGRKLSLAKPPADCSQVAIPWLYFGADKRDTCTGPKYRCALKTHYGAGIKKS